MKKILIVNNNLHIGGVQKALVSLLWNIRDKYDITLLLFHPDGEYKNHLPSDIKVIVPKSGYRYLGMTRQDTTKLRDKIGRSFYAAITRLLGRKYAVKLMAIRQKQLGEFDAVISYLHNSGDKSFYGGCNEFVLKHTSAKKKIAFLHCDYSLCGADTLENKKQYAQFDTIAACSNGCANAFISVNPSLKNKVQVVPNCHRFDKIREASEAVHVEVKENKINIVTVARMGKEKGVERALRVIADLDEFKEKLHYYIIGDGTQMPLVKQIIEQENLSEYVTLCGMLSNPYGYIKAADLLLIPSYSEAAPLVVGEAACLGTPILSMKTSSAQEMIEDTGYGWVCENSEDEMIKTLKTLLSDNETLNSLKIKLLKLKIDNHVASMKFDNLINHRNV